jgi:tetratricopeptide (TPR) repeat protein
MDMKVGSNQHLFKAGLVLVAAALAACGDRAVTYLDEAGSYEQVYAYDEAAARYELVAEAFKRSPAAAAARAGARRCRAQVHFDRAEELIFDGAAYTAVAEIAAGRRVYGADPRADYLTAAVHLEMGAPELALAGANACAVRYPERPFGYLGRAEYYRWTQNREAAFNEYVRAYRVAADEPRWRAAAFRGLRDAARHLGWDESRVQPYYDEGIPETSRAAFDYWVGYYYLRKPPAVIEVAKIYFEKAAAARAPGPYGPRARAGLAECYYFYKDYDEARRNIDAALKADPENDYFYKVAADVYAALKMKPPVKVQK